VTADDALVAPIVAPTINNAIAKGCDGEVVELDMIKYELGDAAAALKELGDSL
jgi:hypothetical protein